MNDFQNIREQCCEANRNLGKSGLVDLTFGNVSVADHDRKAFAIKPSGVDYQKLAPSDMVIVGYDGTILEGVLRPSSDTPTHRCLYLSFPGIRSVVHTHSRAAVAFAQAGREIPCLGTTHADYFHGPVPVTRDMTAEEIRGEYEWETGRVIAERFAGLDPLHVPAVLVRNHGPFVWAVDAAKALETAVALEIVADMAARTLAFDAAVSPLSANLLDKHFFRKHGPNANYGQPA